jgi:outer membrane lipopolysaccharide assembly protein LptE/RlpB
MKSLAAGFLVPFSFDLHRSFPDHPILALVAVAEEERRKSELRRKVSQSFMSIDALTDAAHDLV